MNLKKIKIKKQNVKNILTKTEGQTWPMSHTIQKFNLSLLVMVTKGEQSCINIEMEFSYNFTVWLYSIIHWIWLILSFDSTNFVKQFAIFVKSFNMPHTYFPYILPSLAQPQKIYFKGKETQLCSKIPVRSAEMEYKHISIMP